MPERGTETSILQAVASEGWAARLVPTERRFDLWRELEDRFARGEFDAPFFEERLRSFEQSIKGAPDWAVSILIVAIPDPAFRIRFGWQGQDVALTVPPTFIHWGTLGESRLESLLAGIRGDEIPRTETAILPRKLLATRCGLAKYGRNNLTYVVGMGSYQRLCCLYTDIPCEPGQWHEAEVLDSCGSCGACIRACPAGAIDPDRFLVRAERCITYWHEKPAGVAYPAASDYSWQDQFIGCTHCQAVCPHNRDLLTIEEAGPPFTEEETTMFLRAVAIEELPRETVEKLEQHDILDHLDVLFRNLRNALENGVRRA